MPKPSMPGIITSTIRASGRKLRALSSPSAPLAAVSTSKPWNRRLTDSSSTIIGSSSTTRILASGSTEREAVEGAPAVVMPTYSAAWLEGRWRNPGSFL